MKGAVKKISIIFLKVHIRSLVCVSSTVATQSPLGGDYRCVSQVRPGSETEETDECQPSLKRGQVVKDSARKFAVIIPFLKYFPFSNNINTVFVNFTPGFPNSNQNNS